MILLLIAPPSDEYTMGKLTVGDTTFRTIERPWIHTPEHRGGLGFESCVPGGRYRLIPHDSHRFGKTWALVNHDMNVYHQPDDRPNGIGRYAILLHAGNRASDVVGCIAVGMDSAPGWVSQSQKAMRILRDILPWEEHTLDIVRHPRHLGSVI